MRWWMKLLAAMVVIALLLLLGWNLVDGIWKALNNAQWTTEPDPMFAEEAQTPTRPPEMDEEAQASDHLTLDDLPMREGAPVDKTAEQLIREAENRDNA